MYNERLTQPLFPNQSEHVLELDKPILIHVQFLNDSLPDFVIGFVLDDSERLLEVLYGDATLGISGYHL
jgi:hypothetical protein